jgi:hypothetical protein
VGPYKKVFLKSCSTMLWQIRDLRWPDARQACMVQIRVIEPIQRAYFAPIVMVHRKDSSWHMCLGYRLYQQRNY